MCPLRPAEKILIREAVGTGRAAPAGPAPPPLWSHSRLGGRMHYVEDTRSTFLSVGTKFLQNGWHFSHF